MLFSLVACNSSRKLYGQSINEDKAPPIWTAFTTNESRLKVGEDLPIEFYYAPQRDYSSMTDPMPLSVSAKIFMKHGVYGDLDPSGGSYSFEEIEELKLKGIDNFADSNYYPAAGESSVAFESIVIPAEWFVGERGSIVLTVMVDLIWAEETGMKPITEGGSVGFNYIVEGENIILFDSYYKFFNYIRWKEIIKAEFFLIWYQLILTMIISMIISTIKIKKYKIIYSIGL